MEANSQGEKKPLTLDQSVFMEIKVNFQSTDKIYDTNCCLVLGILNPLREIDYDSLGDERSRKLLSTLDKLGISYEIKSGVRCIGDKSRRESFRYNARIYLYNPPAWSSEHEAISRRISEFEAKQHI